MTAYERGDIVLIPFPFTDLSTFKQRPAAVISSNEFNQTHEDVIVAALTSHIPPSISSDDYLLNASDLKFAGLPKASLVKVTKIVTLDKRLIRKRLGRLPVPTMTKIISQMQQIIGGI